MRFPHRRAAQARARLAGGRTAAASQRCPLRRESVALDAPSENVLERDSDAAAAVLLRLAELAPVGARAREVGRALVDRVDAHAGFEPSLHAQAVGHSRRRCTRWRSRRARASRAPRRPGPSRRGPESARWLDRASRRSRRAERDGRPRLPRASRRAVDDGRHPGRRRRARRSTAGRRLAAAEVRATSLIGASESRRRVDEVGRGHRPLEQPTLANA